MPACEQERPWTLKLSVKLGFMCSGNSYQTQHLYRLASAPDLTVFDGTSQVTEQVQEIITDFTLNWLHYSLLIVRIPISSLSKHKLVFLGFCGFMMFLPALTASFFVSTKSYLFKYRGFIHHLRFQKTSLKGITIADCFVPFVNHNRVSYTFRCRCCTFPQLDIVIKRHF